MLRLFDCEARGQDCSVIVSNRLWFAGSTVKLYYD
jgi:hypothetical protein